LSANSFISLLAEKPFSFPQIFYQNFVVKTQHIPVGFIIITINVKVLNVDKVNNALL